jgi:hypothetical protein
VIVGKISVGVRAKPGTRVLTFSANRVVVGVGWSGSTVAVRVMFTGRIVDVGGEEAGSADAGVHDAKTIRPIERQ